MANGGLQLGAVIADFGRAVLSMAAQRQKLEMEQQKIDLERAQVMSVLNLRNLRTQEEEKARKAKDINTAQGLIDDEIAFQIKGGGEQLGGRRRAAEEKIGQAERDISRAFSAIANLTGRGDQSGQLLATQFLMMASKSKSANAAVNTAIESLTAEIGQGKAVSEDTRKALAELANNLTSALETRKSARAELEALPTAIDRSAIRQRVLQDFAPRVIKRFGLAENDLGLSVFDTKAEEGGEEAPDVIDSSATGTPPPSPVATEIPVPAGGEQATNLRGFQNDAISQIRALRAEADELEQAISRGQTAGNEENLERMTRLRAEAARLTDELLRRTSRGQ